MPWTRHPELSKKERRELLQEYRRRARFLLDESVPRDVIDLLAKSGWNAKHVTDLGLGGHPDENILAYAKREDRILLTHDPDFLDDRAFPLHQNPGLIVLPGAQGNRRALLTALGDVVGIVGASRDLWRATKIVIAEGRTWTVRTFDEDVGVVTTTRYRIIKGGVEIWQE